MIFVVDVEADGPCPGIYSMIQYGVVALDSRGILGKITHNLAPTGDVFLPEALNAIGITRQETLNYPDAKKSMYALDDFVSRTAHDRPVFFSDNNGFDWQFINYYFWKFVGRNPFGFSSNNITNIYGGLNKQLRNGKWRDFRITKHSHNALDDAQGNAEALLEIAKRYNINLDKI
jgi:DNA polymerase III epsilon subunit-like protein